MVPEAALEKQCDAPERAEPAKATWLWLLLLPAIFLACHAAFLKARGPFYLGPNLDPDYSYLCNSLNIATGRGPQHADHPGTALQVLGAVVIKLAHPFANSAQTIAAVLKAPERHLHGINLVLAWSYAAGLALVGIVVWQRTGDWLAALLLQAGPFMLGDQFRVVARVSAEPLLLMVGVLMMTLLFLNARAEGSGLRMSCGLGFLAALGTVTKLNFFPMALVPLAGLRTRKQHALYLLSAVVFGCLWLIPAMGRGSYLGRWVKGLASKQGDYGSGESGLVPPEYLSNLLRLLTENPWLCLLLGVSWLAVHYGWRRRGEASPQARRWLLLLAGLALGQSLQTLTVAKYAQWRYLLPALMFCPLNFLLLLELSRPWLPRKRAPVLAAGGLALAGLALPLRAHYLQFSKGSADRKEVARALESEFKGDAAVYFYGASSLYHALWFGNYWAGGHYTGVLRDEIFRRHPLSYVVHDWTGTIFWMGQKHSSLADLGQQHRSFLLVGSTSAVTRASGLLPASAQTQKLLESGREVITRVTFTGSAP